MKKRTGFVLLVFLSFGLSLPALTRAEDKVSVFQGAVKDPSLMATLSEKVMKAKDAYHNAIDSFFQEPKQLFFRNNLHTHSTLPEFSRTEKS